MRVDQGHNNELVKDDILQSHEPNAIKQVNCVKCHGREEVDPKRQGMERGEEDA